MEILNLIGALICATILGLEAYAMLDSLLELPLSGRHEAGAVWERRSVFYRATQRPVPWLVGTAVFALCAATQAVEPKAAVTLAFVAGVSMRATSAWLQRQRGARTHTAKARR